MPSLTTLLGRPVHQLVNANVSSANHVAATRCIKACSRGTIVGAREAGLNILETADLLGFSSPRNPLARALLYAIGCGNWKQF